MSSRVTIVSIVCVLVATLTMLAKVETRKVEFKQASTIIPGVVAWDAAISTRRPGVLIVHGGFGYTDQVRAQARRIAEAGYVGFAFDMYEEGEVATHAEHSGAMMRALNDNPSLVRAKFNAALEELKRDPHVDPKRVSAIGYCWGGGVVLDMARNGADLDAVVTFHGLLDTKTPAQPGNVKSRILILTGDLDPLVPREKVDAFRREMQAAAANFQIITYPNAKHGFTTLYANEITNSSLKYDAEVDRESWAAFLKFLGEVYR
jgi:dienelactone hydrolase